MASSHQFPTYSYRLPHIYFKIDAPTLYLITKKFKRIMECMYGGSNSSHRKCKYSSVVVPNTKSRLSACNGLISPEPMSW